MTSSKDTFKLDTKDVQTTVVHNPDINKFIQMQKDKKAIVVDKKTTYYENKLSMKQKSLIIDELTALFEQKWKAHPETDDNVFIREIVELYEDNKDVTQFMQRHPRLCNKLVFQRDQTSQTCHNLKWVFKVASIENDQTIAQKIKDRELYKLQNTLFDSCLTPK